MQINYNEANSANFSKGRSDSIQYIVVHFTANNGDTATNNASYFNTTVTKTSAHYFVDEGSEVWQSVQDGDTAWHCGTSGVYRHPYCRNSNSIGVELCSRMDELGKFYFRDETIANAISLICSLMYRYDIPIINILRHFDVTGKICPAPFIDLAEGNQVSQGDKVKSNNQGKSKAWQDFIFELSRMYDISNSKKIAEANSPIEMLSISTTNFNLLGKGICEIRGFNMDGVLYVGARELLEGLDYLVGWDDKTKTVLVRKKTIIETHADELAVLERIVEAEAGGEDELGKILVVNVILNRINDAKFPNSIIDVVSQPSQFEPMHNGAFDLAIPSCHTINAVHHALNGVDYSKGALYFCSTASASKAGNWHESALTRLFVHGGHIFYK